MSSHETLRTQYEFAMELYQHEDNLNWNKLNNLFYVNMGLCAIIGFFIDSGTGGGTLQISTRFMFGVICLVGLIISAAFGVAIWYGIFYLQKRKEAVVMIEEKLIADGGVHVVSVPEEKHVHLHISPTTWMLRLVPVLLAIVWGVLFIFNVIV